MISFLLLPNKSGRVFFTPWQVARCYLVAAPACLLEGGLPPQTLRRCWVSQEMPLPGAPDLQGEALCVNTRSTLQPPIPCTSRGNSVFRGALNLYMKSSRSSSSSENANGFWTWWGPQAFTPPSSTSPSTTEWPFTIYAGKTKYSKVASVKKGVKTGRPRLGTQHGKPGQLGEPRPQHLPRTLQEIQDHCNGETLCTGNKCRLQNVLTSYQGEVGVQVGVPLSFFFFGTSVLTDGSHPTA